MEKTVLRMAEERKFASLDIGEVAQDGSFHGYASVFGRVDLGRDVVERGAFKKSLERRGPEGIRMLFQHDPAQPIGSWSQIREDDRGLFVVGKLATGVAKARDVLELMRGRALDGLSVGFRTIQSVKDARTGVRHIRKADLWEISVVTFPMQPEARIENVKGVDADNRAIPSTREFERWLVRDAGLTRSEAKTVIVKGFAYLKRERDAALAMPHNLADRLRQAAKQFQL